MTYYLADGGHVLISGATGSRKDYGGKTVLANWWASNLVAKGHRDVSVFINPKGHGFVRGNRVRSQSGLQQSLNAGTSQINYTKPHPNAVVAELAKRNANAVVVFDEAWEYDGSWGLNQTVRKLGNIDGGGIRGLVVSQRPWDLTDAVLNSTPLIVWVGPLTNEGQRYFETMNMSQEAAKINGKMEPYQWAVFDGGELQEVNDPVPASFA